MAQWPGGIEGDCTQTDHSEWDRLPARGENGHAASVHRERHGVEIPEWFSQELERSDGWRCTEVSQWLHVCA